MLEQTRELRRRRREVRAGNDPEAVHQMRVATRRLRAALRVFRGQLEVPPRIVSGLARLARRLGDVRDADVLIGLLAAHRATANPAESRRLGRLIAARRRRRAKARAALVRELERGRTAALLEALNDFGRRPREAAPHEVVAARVLAEAVAAQAERISAHAGMRQAAPAPEALHDLRIDFKRLRYTLDFHAAAFGLSYDVERRLARQLQDVLGEIHDRDLLLDRLARPRGPWRGPWPGVQQRLAAERQALVRRFLRLRRRWRAQTGDPDDVPDAGRFATLEPARITLRLVSGSAQH